MYGSDSTAITPRPRWTRRRLWATSATALLVPAIAACGSGEKAAPHAAPKTIAGTVELWGDATYPFDKTVGADVIKEIEGKHPGLKINWTPVNDGGGEKLRVAAAGGSPPDLHSLNSIVVQDVAKDGIAASLEDQLKTSATLKKADLWPAFVQEQSWKGALHAMTYTPDIRLLYVHADRFRRAGLDPDKPPKTWDELEASITKTAERDGGEIKAVGFDPFMGSGGTNLWLVPFWQVGGETLSADGTKATIANDKGLKAWTWIKKIIDQQGGWQAMKDMRQGRRGEKIFVDGGAANYYATNSNRALMRGLMADIQFGFGTYPIAAGGRRASYGAAPCWVLCRGAKAPEGAWAFLETLLTPENNIRWSDTHDRVPVRQSVARSDAYIRGDAFKKFVAEEMQGRKFLIAAPGAWQMREDIMGVATDILEKGVPIMDALNKAQTAIQNKLDDALRAAK